jgi:hypothetical protein
LDVEKTCMCIAKWVPYIVLSHPPTAREGIAHMHLDHQPIPLAPTFGGHCYEIEETIDVHFKWKNYNIVGLTKKLSNIPPSLCFR